MSFSFLRPDRNRYVMFALGFGLSVLGIAQTMNFVTLPAWVGATLGVLFLGSLMFGLGVSVLDLSLKRLIRNEAEARRVGISETNWGAFLLGALVPVVLWAALICISVMVGGIS